MNSTARDLRSQRSVQAWNPPGKAGPGGLEINSTNELPFNPIVASDCAQAVARVLGRAHTLGQALALAITDPRLDLHGTRRELSLGVSALKRLACCDDEAIHSGMRLLVRGGIVRWRFEPGPGTEAEWWVPTVPEAWESSADNPPVPKFSGGSGHGKSARAGNRFHACAFQHEKKTENSYITSIEASTSTEMVGEKSADADDRPDSNGATDDPTWDEAVILLRSAGVTPGQEEGILRRMHRSLKPLPAVVVVKAAIREMGSAPRPGGWLRRALTDGFNRILARAKCLHAEMASPMAVPTASAKIQVFKPLAKPQGGHTAASAEELAAAVPWERIRGSLSKLMPEQSFKEWIEPLCPLRFMAESRTLVISAPCASVRLWVDQQLDAEVAEALVDAGLEGIQIEYEVASIERSQ